MCTTSSSLLSCTKTSSAWSSRAATASSWVLGTAADRAPHASAKNATITDAFIISRMWQVSRKKMPSRNQIYSDLTCARLSDGCLGVTPRATAKFLFSPCALRRRCLEAYAGTTSAHSHGPAAASRRTIWGITRRAALPTAKRRSCGGLDVIRLFPHSVFSFFFFLTNRRI